MNPLIKSIKKEIEADPEAWAEYLYEMENPEPIKPFYRRMIKHPPKDLNSRVE